MTLEADAAIVSLLEGLAIPTDDEGVPPQSLASGANLFLGPIVEGDQASKPAKAVFVELIREKSTRFCGTSSDYRQSWVLVSCRADLSDYDGNQALVRAIRDALLAPTVEGYTSVAVDDGPFLARIDQSGRTVWQLTAILTRTT